MPEITSFLNESRRISPPFFLRRNALIQDYEADYRHALTDPEGFWSEIAEKLLWEKKWDKVLTFEPPKHDWVHWRQDQHHAECVGIDTLSIIVA
jgi:hypothetical protein